MKKFFVSAGAAIFLLNAACAQDIKSTDVPAAVKSALSKKYPEATKVSWEKENGNYEANWGGKSGEDNAAQFTPVGVFVEIEKAIPVSELPASVKSYLKNHEGGATIKEAARITDANGKTTYEADVRGNYLKTATGD